MTAVDVYAILPQIVVIGSAALLLLIDLWIPRERKSITALLAAAALASALGLTLAQSSQSLTAFSGMVVIDGQVKCQRSRNTPPATRIPTIIKG